ncbi:MAG: hypothetical protein ACYTGL_00175 [Planctomycetota bacterium]
MKNGSFDLAFRTMTIGLLMFLVLSIVSVGIHSLQPGAARSSSQQLASSGGQVIGVPVAQPLRVDDSARITDEMRREFASSLGRVSDRLTGIEQRFATLTPGSSDVPTAQDAQLRASIETTQRRLEHLGDRLTDRIQSIHVASEVELRDLNRQLAHLVDEQQQIQEEVVNVRVAAERGLRPAKLAQVRSDRAVSQNSDPSLSTRQARLSKNLEAMVTELATLREQLQAVQLAAAKLEPSAPGSEDQRVAISLKVPQPGSKTSLPEGSEPAVDKPVPEPNDLDARSESPSSIDAEPSVEPIDQPASPATLDGTISLPESSLPEPPSTDTLPEPVDEPSIDSGPEAVVVPELREDDQSLTTFTDSPAAAAIEGPLPLPSVSIDLPDPLAADPESLAVGLPAADLPVTEPLVSGTDAVAQPDVDVAAPMLSDDEWNTPIAARPVSTIFPADSRRQPERKPAENNPAQQPTNSLIDKLSGDQSSTATSAPVRVALPAPAPVDSLASEPQLSEPAPFPAIVAEIVEPTAPETQPVAEPPAVGLNAREPQRISRQLPEDARRAPLSLADGPVIRPFELPTREPKRTTARKVAEAPESAERMTLRERFSLLTSKGRPSKNSSRGVTNAKWRAARRGDNSDSRPSLQDSRSLFPDVPASAIDTAASSIRKATNVDDHGIPLPQPVPQNEIRRTSIESDEAPVIDPVSAEIAGPQRRFTVRATVLHISADDLTSLNRAGTKLLAVMGGHDYRVSQIRHAVRASDFVEEIYTGQIEATGGIPSRLPIGWLCPHCNDESGVENGDHLVVTLPHSTGDSQAKFYVEQADGTGRSESFGDTASTLIPGASIQITEAAQDGTVETVDARKSNVLTRLPVIGNRFEKTTKTRQIMQRVIVLTIREQPAEPAQPIRQLSGQKPAGGSQVVHAAVTAPAGSAAASRRPRFVHDSSGATVENAGLITRVPAPAVED